MHIVVAGGGTAGHIEPALNTADAIRASHPTDTVSVLGTAGGLEATLVPARGYALTEIPRVPLPRRITADLITLPVRLRRAVKLVEQHLVDSHADVVVGFGGYVALPAYLAARNLRIPIVVHEANARAGLANRIACRFADAVVETVAGSIPGAFTLGLPLRPAIRNFDRDRSRAEALQLWPLNPSRTTLLVFGGSLGARHLNEVVAEAAPALTSRGIQILHSVGRKNSDHLRDDVPGYLTVPYIDRMDAAYAIADLALTRAGAMTVAELTAVGLPAMYVPLPIGNGEQRLNARDVVAAGGGVLIDDGALTADVLTATVDEWMQVGLADKAAAAYACGHRDDVEKFVDVIRGVAQKGTRR